MGTPLMRLADGRLSVDLDVDFTLWSHWGDINSMPPFRPATDELSAVNGGGERATRFPNEHGVICADAK